MTDTPDIRALVEDIRLDALVFEERELAHEFAQQTLPALIASDALIKGLVEALQNVGGHIDTPIARRRLGISNPQPDWLVGMRAALKKAQEHGYGK